MLERCCHGVWTALVCELNHYNSTTNILKAAPAKVLIPEQRRRHRICFPSARQANILAAELTQKSVEGAAAL